MEAVKESVMVYKAGELLAELTADGVLYTIDLHCQELALVWYSLLSMKHGIQNSR
jgi:hypothetical protein